MLNCAKQADQAGVLWLAMLLLSVGLPTFTAAADEPRVLTVVRDFEGEKLGTLPAIQHHTWTAEQRLQADQFSQCEIVAEQGFGAQCCKLTLGEKFPWGNRNEYRVLNLGPDYLAPEVDVVRLRVKVLQGKFRFAVGSPTVYFGHSDVQSVVQEVTAQPAAEWQTLEFSLQEDLERNFRRARFGAKSPVIYYTRWIQEPLYLYVCQTSAGKVLIDQVELVATGKGKSFPVFEPEQVRQVANIADFESPAELVKAFTYFQEPIDFNKAPHLVRPDWKPPVLNLVEAGHAGKSALQWEQRGTEETCFAGVKALGQKTANAIEVTLRAKHAGPGEEVALDFMVYVTLPDQQAKFPWQRFAAPTAWRDSPLAFDYYLSQTQTRELSYGFYHLRRAVPKDQWTTIILPCADFICAYGQEGCAALFEQQLPLQCEQIVAIGMISPYRQRREVTRVQIDAMSFVAVPGTADQLRSFWQTPVAK